MIHFLQKTRNLKLFGSLALVLFISILIIKGSLPIFDLKFFYTQSEVLETLATLGESGRKKYLFITIIDFIFMFCFTVFLMSSYALSFKSLSLKEEDILQAEAQIKILWILPLMYYFIDLLETSMIFYSLWVFPMELNYLYIGMVLATPLKWFLVLASLLVLVNGLLLKKYISSQQ